LALGVEVVRVKPGVAETTRAEVARATGGSTKRREDHRKIIAIEEIAVRRRTVHRSLEV